MVKTMKFFKPILMIFVLLATAILALTLALNSRDSPQLPELPEPPVYKRAASRFLQQSTRNPRAAHHCHKNNEMCKSVLAGKANATCCNNKCVDLAEDSDNCGACKEKCAFTDWCCGGRCVDLSYDKRHCGWCNNRCMPGGYCIYGLCDYA